MCGGGGRLVDPGESVTHTERPRGQGKRMWWAWAWGSTAPPPHTAQSSLLALLATEE